MSGHTYTHTRLANRPGIPGIVPEIVLLSRRPGNLPNVPGSLANWLRFQAAVSVCDIHTRNATALGERIHTRNATALGERRQPHAVLRNLQNFQLTCVFFVLFFTFLHTYVYNSTICNITLK